ncbi:xanthine dehydrogenase/oxidase-like [Nymphalis io]|uniref:xanthine dehydrogenase/oxidase-like n=1 Tax=Inachis io TaxID=171585 RepID=UPI0021685E42|nr:xanthine dehydrogenase/oxidase-like [Nymphalis io]
MTCVEFTVNGQKCTVNNLLHRETSLSAYIRYFLGLPGTKAMCRQGVCGACIVNVTARRHISGEIETFSVNSCLVLVFSCHGWDITTVEAIGSRGQGYSEFQKRIAAFHGTQCGYCTPGWVMNLFSSLLPKKLKMIELENSFGSNTCRCTGYRSIYDTIKSFAVDASPELCQQVDDIEELAMCIKDKTRICNRKCSETISENDWTMVNEVRDSDAMIMLNFGDKTFFKVFQEDQIFQLFTNYGVDNYMFIDGNTGKAVVYEIQYPDVLIDISAVSSLKQYHFDQNLVLGANIALEECLDIFKKTAATMDDFTYLEEFAKHLDLVAQMPVRNIGSLAGNIMLKHIKPSYRSDVFLLFEAVGATVTIRGGGNERVSLGLPEFLKYDMKGKLILNFELPPQGPNHILRSYKIMPRSQNALAIVNAAFNIKMNTSTSVIEKATIVFGNISGTFIHATQTEAYLKGKNVFSNKILQGAISRLNNELVPVEEPAQPTPAIRKKLAIGLFYKFILSITPTSILNPKYVSGGSLIKRPLSSGKQDFQTDSSLYPLNQPVQKLEAIIQSSGEARYVNDIPPLPKEVFGAFVLSTVHNGDVDTVDVESALAIPDVVAVFTAKDVPGVNSFTFPGFQLQIEDEVVLADKNIKYYGQPVAIVVATTEELASSVARKVKVTYINVTNVAPVLTINQAKQDAKRIIPGDTIEPKGRGTNVRKVIRGVFEVGAQYHYYLEPLSCVTIPVDNGFEVHDVTQWMDLTQGAVSRFLNISESDVHVKVRRLGGGFGGKISRNVQVACASALVAKALDRPCRFILPLDTNLTIAGRRLPCQCEYEVGVDNNGKIQYLNASFTEDVGFSNNENVLAYVLSSFANCYNIDYFSVKSFAVTTDLPSNTFARAPGTLEGITSIENIMEHIAVAVNKDPTEVRLANMRQEDNDLPSLIETLKTSAEYEKRLQEIKTFNKNNRWMKKSIQISVMLFPVIYYGNYTAMVSIYRGDGTVTVTTGGIEMGQGVNTKAAQVCAYELGIPLEKVTVIPNYSFVAANNIFSGSSIVSECVSYSIIKACETLKARLKPLKDQMNNPTWEELIKKAGDDLIDLTSTYMMTDKDPQLQGYSAFAVTIIEVQLDALTGKFDISRADILEDVGLSANPKIDVGQVEGAYVQGLSYFTSEKLIFDKTTGRLLTNSALDYEVYLAKDIPADFRVNLRYNSYNSKGVLGSKAVGEMGICSSHGIIYALRQCIRESRKESGYDTTQWLDIDLPLTAESILKALNVKNSEFILS